MRSYVPAYDMYIENNKLQNSFAPLLDLHPEQESIQTLTAQEPAENGAVAEVTYELRVVNGAVVKRELSRVLKDEQTNEMEDAGQIGFEKSQERRANHRMKLQPNDYPKIS